VVHAASSRPEVAPEHRYLKMQQYYGTLVSDSVTCGCHVHVGIEDLDTAVRVINHLRPWLPALLGLSANSPFYLGRDTGYASSRYMVWSRWPTAGPPPYLESAEQYESLVQGLLNAEAAMDRKMIYWDARPSEQHDTVEVRVHDVQGTAAEAAFLGVLVRQLVVEAVACGQRADPIPHIVLRGNMWRAARDGLAGRCLEPRTGELAPVLDIVTDLVQRLPDSDEAACAKDVLGRLRADGGGAQRQRKAFERRGDLDDVLAMLVKQT
jgi:carboxylate-amine ligase